MRVIFMLRREQLQLSGEASEGRIKDEWLNSPDAHYVIRAPTDNEHGDNGYRHFQSAYTRST